MPSDDTPSDPGDPNANTIYVYSYVFTDQSWPDVRGCSTPANGLLVSVLVEEEAHLRYGGNSVHSWIGGYIQKLMKAMRQEWNKNKQCSQ